MIITMAINSSNFTLVNPTCIKFQSMMWTICQFIFMTLTVNITISYNSSWMTICWIKYCLSHLNRVTKQSNKVTQTYHLDCIVWVAYKQLWHHYHPNHFGPLDTTHCLNISVQSLESHVHHQLDAHLLQCNLNS